MIARLIELECKFWRYVGPTHHRQPTGRHPRRAALLSGDNGQVVNFSSHAGLTTAYILKALRRSWPTGKARGRAQKQMLQAGHGRRQSSRGVLLRQLAQGRRHRFDVAQLLKDKPYLQAKYPLLKPGARLPGRLISSITPSLASPCVRGWPPGTLKGLRTHPSTLGRISIGKVVEKRRLPEKDDQFTIVPSAGPGWLAVCTQR